MDGERSKSLAGLLNSAVGQTDHLFGSDVKVVYHLLTTVLEHESLHQGFELSATHDSDFNKVQYDTHIGVNISFSLSACYPHICFVYALLLW